MSANEGYNVYVSREDFKNHYPGMLKYGYHTSYECMGLFGDPSVPWEVKWGQQTMHIHNVRYQFPVNEGYSVLLEILSGKDYFIHTSNVDGHFDRAGFDKARIYTPQGDFAYYQCRKPCQRKKVYPARDLIDRVLPHIDAKTSTILDSKLVPTCPDCGYSTFSNVRGGGWFIHAPYNDQQDRLIEWVESVQATKQKLVVLEVGVGFNTPIVTRFPMESIVRETPGAALIRINPQHYKVEPSIPGLGIQKGWQVLMEMRDILQVPPTIPTPAVPAPDDSIPVRHYHWKEMLANLR